MENKVKTSPTTGVDLVMKIGTGLVAIGALGAIVGLSYALVQMTGEGGGGGGGSTTNTSTGQTTTTQTSSLTVGSVTGASVVVDNDRTAQALTLQSGSTVLGSVGPTGEFTAGTALTANQDLTLKYSTSVANDQMIIVRYRSVQDTQDRLLTLCVGSGNATTLYVGTDGSTFQDSKLKKRTTKEACGSIRSRALRPTHLDWGEIATEFSRTWSQINRFNLYRGTNLLGWFVSGFQDETTVVAEEGDPLRIVVSEFGAQLANDVVAPRGLLTVTTDPRTTSDDVWGLKPTGPSWYLCAPEVAYNVTTRSGYKIFYFDTSGTPYADIFLRTKAMTGTCSATVQRALRFSRIDTGSIAYGTSSTWTQYGSYKVRHIGGATVATFNTLGEFTSKNLGLNLDTVEFSYDPVSVQPFYAYSLAPIPQITYPRAVINLTGVVAPYDETGPMQPVTASLCFPEQIVELPSNIGYYYTFFDTQGNPYRDIFLEQRLSCDRTGLTPQ